MRTKDSILTATLVSALTLGGGAFAEGMSGPKDPAGTPTGQMQRDAVEQEGEAQRGGYPERGPRAPAGSPTGQMQRDRIEQEGEAQRGGYPERGPRAPAGTPTGEMQRDRIEQEGDARLEHREGGESGESAGAP